MWQHLVESGRLRTSWGVLSMFFSIFLFFSFVSYFYTAQADQSTVDSVLAGRRVSSTEVQNWIGLAGAIFANLFIYKAFGVGSFLFLPTIFHYGYKITYERLVFDEWKYLKIATFFAFWISTLLGAISIGIDSHNLSFFCGEVGFTIAKVINSLFGGLTFLLLAVSIVLFKILNFGNNLGIPFLNFQVPDSILELADLIKGVKIPSMPKPKNNHFSEKNPKESKPRETQAEQANERGNEQESKPERPSQRFNFGKKEVEVQHFTEKEEAEIGNELDLKIPLKSKLPKEQPSLDFNIEDMTLEVTEVVENEEEVVEEEDFETKAKNLLNKFGLFDPTLDLSSYQFPPIEIMNDTPVKRGGVTKEELESNKDRIVETLSNFGIGIERIKATIGPTVTLYEIVPQAGIKISKIKNLEDDIALSLSALGIRIIAPMPGQGTIGIEVPNKNREMVPIRMVLSHERFAGSQKELPIVLGKTISNEVFVTDLAKMPHLLMAGATGQGKSVGLNVILASLIYKKHPSELKLVLVDPKKVELSLFNKLERHFLAALPNSEEPIITDTKLVVHTLNSLCIEMDVRYNLLKTAHCRNLKEYNAKYVKRLLNPEDGHRYLPYIVLVIDELADLMMTAGKEVEMPIARLAQLARAIGIHLVVATQRPSVNVITGIIKANFPARLSFKVTSKVDSRTILDTGGAEQLVGQGDMLLSNGSEIIRLQCPFVDTDEIENLCDFISSQRGFANAYQLPEYIDENAEVEKVDLDNRDGMFEEAARLVVTHQQGSTSLIQRKLSLGYNRAGRIIDQLEAAGVVGAFEGSKARKVLVKTEDELNRLLSGLDQQISKAKNGKKGKE